MTFDKRNSDPRKPTAFFSSRRERRLWLWSLVIAVTIYSTLGLSRTLAGILRERGLLVMTFALALLLVAATVAALGLKARASGPEIGVALGFAAVYLMVFTRMALPEERTHLIEYGVLAVFVFEALSERWRGKNRLWKTAALALTITVSLGWIDEGIQWFLPNRVYDNQDVLFNTLAAFMAISARVALAWARRWWGAKANQSAQE